jgi:hypothetical protein
MAAVMWCIAVILCFICSTAIAQPAITVTKPNADVFIHEWDGNDATVSVTDRSGETIRGLTPADFRVVLEGVAQARIRSVALDTLRDSKAIGLSFVIDNSASIFHGYDSITKYLDRFIRKMPGDVLMSAYVFDDMDRSRMHEATKRGDVYIAPSGDTHDRDSISRFWHFYDTIRSEFTPLYDQVGLAMWNIQRRKDRGDTNRLNIVIVVSDGTDNASRTSIEDLSDLVSVSDVRLYVLTYRSEPDRRLSWLANRARGASYTLQTLEGISVALEELRTEMTMVYKIRYVPDPKKRRDLPKSPTLVRP